MDEAAWDRIHAKLAHVKRLVEEEGPGRSPETAGNLLRARARALAKETAGETDRRAGGYLVFARASFSFLVDQRFVQEAFRLPELVPVPGADPFLAGFFGHEGGVTAAVELPVLLQLSREAIKEEAAMAVMFRTPGLRFAVLATAVKGLRSVAPAEIERLAGHGDDASPMLPGRTAGGEWLLDPLAIQARLSGRAASGA